MKLIAVGDNVTDCYLDEGIYYPGGNAHYKGNFELNQYQGQGYLYFENGRRRREGKLYWRVWK